MGREQQSVRLLHAQREGVRRPHDRRAWRRVWDPRGPCRRHRRPRGLRRRPRGGRASPTRRRTHADRGGLAPLARTCRPRPSEIRAAGAAGALHALQGSREELRAIPEGSGRRHGRGRREHPGAGGARVRRGPRVRPRIAVPRARRRHQGLVGRGRLLGRGARPRRRHGGELMATQQVEAGAAGHGAEPRGKRGEDGQATYLIAIAEALWEEMERDERVFMLGEDIGVYGGAFKVTEGFIERFGPERVMDTPIAEETIVGMSVGAAMEGLRPVAEFQYADFMSSGFDEITTVLSRYHYRAGVPLPVVLRGPSGGGVRASSFHSINPEPWYAYAGGIKIMCPAFPSDAKGLLKSAIRDDNPSMFLEHKWIYRRIKEQVSEDPEFLVPIGAADVKREGSDVSIITYGAMVHKALEAAEALAQRGISAEIVDLRTVYPLDEETILRSIEKTSRALVLYESYRFLGIGTEVAAVIAEKAFEHLDAPVVRLAPPNVPVPFSPPLEDAFLPQIADIEAAVDRLAGW